MPEIKPISRKELIAKLNALGFKGPFRATKHQYVLKGRHKYLSQTLIKAKI